MYFIKSKKTSCHLIYSTTGWPHHAGYRKPPEYQMLNFTNDEKGNAPYDSKLKRTSRKEAPRNPPRSLAPSSTPIFTTNHHRPSKPSPHPTFTPSPQHPPSKTSSTATPHTPPPPPPSTPPAPQFPNSEPSSPHPDPPSSNTPSQPPT